MFKEVSPSLSLDEAGTVAQILQFARSFQTGHETQGAHTGAEQVFEAVVRIRVSSDEDLLADIDLALDALKMNRKARLFGRCDATPETDRDALLRATDAVEFMSFVDSSRAYNFYRAIFDDPVGHMGVLGAAISGLSYLTMIRGEPALDLWRAVDSMLEGADDEFDGLEDEFADLKEHAGFVKERMVDRMQSELEEASLDQIRMPNNFRLSWELVEHFLPEESEEDLGC